MLNGQIQHVVTSDNPGGVEYSDIPVYGRKTLNEVGMGKSGGNKVEGKSKGNKQGKGNKKIRNEKVIPNVDVKNRFALLEKLKEEGGKNKKKKLNKVIEKTKIENNEEEKEEENCNQNCEEVVCEDEEEIGGFWLFKFYE
ncbi:unnamed protein product [Meloidogyne enterolobii]|uniref:Uncharacterized protein n=1 Tax=Meloidogyne enterolobii TaxID=390850 RepID=A0ACB1AGE7_MELEN